MSTKYAFIPTIDIVNQMRGEGFQPVAAVQSLTRIAGKGDFTRHMLRFRDMRQGDAPAIRALGAIYPEVVLTNSHDGASAYKLDAGIFRLVCLNGMMVCDANIAQMNVRHTGSPDGIIEASYQIVAEFPKVLESVERFAALRLEAPEQTAYADAALQLRYEEGAVPVSAAQVITPRREADRGSSLWTTFNVVQEHLVNGGQRGRSPQSSRRMRTRPITGITEDARLNKALWTLTNKMAELAG